MKLLRPLQLDGWVWLHVERVGVPWTSDQAGVHALVACWSREMAVAMPSEQAAFRELLLGRSVYHDGGGPTNLASPSLSKTEPEGVRHFLEQSYERTPKGAHQVLSELYDLASIRPLETQVCQSTD